MSAWLVEALVASTLLMVLVLLVRRPVRHAFGPQVGYALWALPLLRLLLPPLPDAWRQVAATPLSRATETITVIVADGGSGGGAVDAGASAMAIGPLIGIAVALLWGAGAAAFLLWHMTSHTRFCRRLLGTAAGIEEVRGVRVIASDAAPGPLAFGVLRRYVAFPLDFADRYDADERELALEHEIGHHQRGDLIANWIALAVLALHWFNPVAWRAFRAFRADQELANDARVLAGRSAIDRHAYACAIVKAAHGGAVSAACHLHTIDDLKGRIRMLTTLPRSRRRLAAGGALVSAVVLAGLGVTASGTSAAERIRTATGIDRIDDGIAAIAAPAQATVPDVPDVPDVPPAPSIAPDAAGAKRAGGDKHRVVVVKDGESKVYEGAEAEAYMAAHPNALPRMAAMPPMPAMAPMPAMPPMAPVPPMKAMQAMRAMPSIRPERLRLITRNALAAAPEVESGTCPGDTAQPVVLNRMKAGKRVMIVCTNRVQAVAASATAAAAASANATLVHRDALKTALASVTATRASIAANASIPPADRASALKDIDEALVELRNEMAGIDKD